MSSVTFLFPLSSLGLKGPFTYLVQRSADEHASACLYSAVGYFLFFSHFYTTFAECIDKDRKIDKDLHWMSQNIAVGTATDYGLDDRGVGAQTPETLRIFTFP
jgi:hypothetical protein